MRLAAIAVVLVLAGAAGARAEQVNLLSPPMITNAGLKEINARYTEKTGTSFVIEGAEIGRLADKIKTANPPADVIFLPTDMIGKVRLSSPESIVTSQSAATWLAMSSLPVASFTPTIVGHFSAMRAIVSAAISEPVRPGML